MLVASRIWPRVGLVYAVRIDWAWASLLKPCVASTWRNHSRVESARNITTTSSAKTRRRDVALSIYRRTTLRGRDPSMMRRSSGERIGVRMALYSAVSNATFTAYVMLASNCPSRNVTTS